MSIKYSGENVLTQIFSLIKSALSGKVDAVPGKGLSENDLTAALRLNYDTAYTHSQTAHAPADARPNVQSDWNEQNSTSDAYIIGKPVIPSISVDIAADSASDSKAASPRAVKAYVDAAVAAGSTGSTFAVLGDGEYDTESGLPTVSGANGVIYLVPDMGGTADSYAEYIYIDGSFERIGSTDIDLTGYAQTADFVEFSNAEVTALWNSIT